MSHSDTSPLPLSEAEVNVAGTEALERVRREPDALPLLDFLADDGIERLLCRLLLDGGPMRGLYLPYRLSCVHICLVNHVSSSQTIRTT